MPLVTYKPRHTVHAQRHRVVANLFAQGQQEEVKSTVTATTLDDSSIGDMRTAHVNTKKATDEIRPIRAESEPGRFLSAKTGAETSVVCSVYRVKNGCHISLQLEKKILISSIDLLLAFRKCSCGTNNCENAKGPTCA